MVDENYLPRSWDKYNPNDWLYVESLQRKLDKHSKAGNGVKCIKYISFMWKHHSREDFYPDSEGMIKSWLDKDIVNRAIKVAKKWHNSQ